MVTGTADWEGLNTTDVWEVEPTIIEKKEGTRMRLFIAGITVITEVLLTEPDVAVIVTVPGATPVTIAEFVMALGPIHRRIRVEGLEVATVAIEGLELVQVTVFVVALTG